MSTAGFSMFGSSGEIKMDKNSQVMHLTRHGTLKDFSSGLPSGLLIDKVPIGTAFHLKLNANERFVAFSNKSASEYIYVGIVSVIDTTSYSIINFVNYSSAAKNDMEYFVYGDGKIPSSSHGVGIEMYDENGQCTFSTKYPPALIIGRLYGAYATNTTSASAFKEYWGNVNLGSATCAAPNKIGVAPLMSATSSYQSSKPGGDTVVKQTATSIKVVGYANDTSYGYSPSYWVGVFTYPQPMADFLILNVPNM